MLHDLLWLAYRFLNVFSLISCNFWVGNSFCCYIQDSDIAILIPFLLKIFLYLHVGGKCLFIKQRKSLPILVLNDFLRFLDIEFIWLLSSV